MSSSILCDFFRSMRQFFLFFVRTDGGMPACRQECAHTALRFDVKPVLTLLARHCHVPYLARDAQLRLALRAGEILVFLCMLDAAEKLRYAAAYPPPLVEELRIFRAARRAVAGKHAENRPDKQRHRYHAQNQAACKQLQQAQRDASPEDRLSQFIRAVAPRHHPGKRHFDFLPPRHIHVLLAFQRFYDILQL